MVVNRKCVEQMVNMSDTMNTTALDLSVLLTYGIAFFVLTKLLALFLNVLVIYLIVFKDHTLRTSFNVYLVNLCIADMIYSLVIYPTHLLNEFNRSLGFEISHMCIGIRYLYHVIPAAINNSHFLIALNRFWAITFPISYRQYHHTAPVSHSVTICGIMWLYIHLALAPGVVMDVWTPRDPPERYECGLVWDGQRNLYRMPLQLLVYDLPIFLVILAYPFMCYRALVRSRRGSTLSISSHQEIYVPVHLHLPQYHTDFSYATNRHSLARSSFVIPRAQLLPKTGYRIMMTLLFLSLTVWTSLFPAQVYYTLLVCGFKNAKVYAIITTLYSLTVVTDPMLILLSAKKIQRALREIWHG